MIPSGSAGFGKQGEGWRPPSQVQGLDWFWPTTPTLGYFHYLIHISPMGVSGAI